MMSFISSSVQVGSSNRSNNKVKVSSVKMMTTTMTMRPLTVFTFFLLLRVFSGHCVRLCMQCMHAHLTGTTLMLSSPNTNQCLHFCYGMFGWKENKKKFKI